MKTFWSWHKQLQLSALMDFEFFFEKVNYLSLVCQISYSQNIYLKVNTVNL